MNLEIGSIVGDYQVVGILGAGGMGQVYKVRNVISDRVEAMKVLLPDLVNQPDLADRFLREIKVQGSLEHPNIAALHTAVRVDNQLLMLMEFVEGVTLDQKLKDGPLPAAEAVNYIMQVLSALDYAHARGVVHRDIKPANMMLTSGGVVKLMDFGAFVTILPGRDGLVHISQISEERIDKIKNVLKVGQEVTARVIKIDKSERRIGLSIKAANYSNEQLKAEQAVLDALKPGEDLVALQHAFDAADEARQDGPKE